MEYIAIMLDEDLNQLGTKKFQPTDTFFTYQKGTFNIRLDAYLYRNKTTTFYGYIYPTDEKLLIDDYEFKFEPLSKKDIKEKEKDNKKVITFNSGRLVKLKEKFEHGDLKLIVGENIIGQLAHIAVMGLKANWLLILIVAVAVGVGAGGIGYAVGVSHAPTYLNVTSPIPTVTFPTPVPYPTIPTLG